MSRAATVLLMALSVLTTAATAEGQRRPPRVHVEPPTVGPAVTPLLWRRVLMRVRPELGACLAPVRGNPRITVRFELSVGEEGHMQLLDAQIPAQASRPDSVACLAEVIARTPAPGTGGYGTLRLGIPIELRPGRARR